jgi:hypothetical protein
MFSHGTIVQKNKRKRKVFSAIEKQISIFVDVVTFFLPKPLPLFIPICPILDQMAFLERR